MPFLGSKLVDDILDSGETLLDTLTTNSVQQQRNFEKDGFIVPPIPSASGDGLPSSKIPSRNQHRIRRHIIHWFVPEVGVINMYVNPQSINYRHGKLINAERTKGGYTVTYWGENLTTLTIQGHTGSSGYEGINVLYEIYRSEQLNFDPIGLTIASNSSTSGLGDLLSNTGADIGGLAGGIVSATSGILGLNPLTQSILPRNPPTLASLACSVEMYYSGKVYRGFFTSFDVTERAEQLGLFDYTINFTVTQQRGYRINTLPWQRSAISGPSNNQADGSGIPLSYGVGPQFRQ